MLDKNEIKFSKKPPHERHCTHLENVLDKRAKNCTVLVSDNYHVKTAFFCNIKLQLKTQVSHVEEGHIYREQIN